MAHSTNSFTINVEPGSKEFMLLDKLATIDFKPDAQYNLEPANSDILVDAIDRNSKHYAYNLIIARVPTQCVIAADDPMNITYDVRVNMLKDWNKTDFDTIQKNATMTWGNCSWTITADKQIVELSQERGEIDAGVRGGLNARGKKRFNMRWKSKILGHQLLALLDETSRRIIMVNEDQFMWFNEDTGEVVYDGLTVLFFILQIARPNVKVNVYNEIQKLKLIKLSDYQGNVVLWLTSMEHKLSDIEHRIHGSYHEDQYLMDIFAGAEQSVCERFNNSVAQIKEDWIDGNEAGWTKEKVTAKLKRLYINMQNDGTWKKDTARHSQILALTTEVTSLRAELNRTAVALATATSTNGTSTPSGPKGPYTVKAWRLEKEGETKVVSGRTYHWCTKTHYSGGKEHNGMYCLHDTAGHDAWRKQHDAEKARKEGENPVPPDTNNTAKTVHFEQPSEPKKLSLSEKLRTALATTSTSNPWDAELMAQEN